MGPISAATFPTSMSPRPMSMDLDEGRSETTSDSFSKLSNTPSLHRSERLEKIESAQVVLYTVDLEGRQCIYFTSRELSLLAVEMPSTCVASGRRKMKANTSSG